MKKINIVSFHSIKGGVGKTTVCLLTFMKLANSLREKHKNMTAKDLANRLWVVDLDIGGRPMFYKPLSETENRDFTLLDILSSRSKAAERKLSERGPYIHCKDTSPINPGEEYSIELIRAINEQALGEKAGKNAGLGRFLGMFLNDAITHFNEASPTDYYRLVDRMLDLITTEASTCSEESDEPIWLLIDCPAGWQRTNRAVMHVIQDRLRWKADNAETTTAWQPVWITTPDNYILTQSIEWLIAPKPDMPGVIAMHPTLLYNNMVSQPQSSTDIERKSSTDLKYVTWALAQHNGILQAYRKQGLYDKTSQREVPIIFPNISPKKDGPIAPCEQDIFADALGEPLLSGELPVPFSDGHCYWPPQSVDVPQSKHSKVPVVPAPDDRENTPAPEKAEKQNVAKEVSAADRAVALKSALEAASIGGVAAVRELPKALFHIQASPKDAKPDEIVKLAEAAANCGMLDVAYAFYSVLQSKAEFMKDFGLVASYLRFLLENKYTMSEADPDAKSIIPAKVARFYLDHFVKKREKPWNDFNYVYLEAFVGGPAQAQKLLDFITPILPERIPEDLMIALSILPLIEDKEKATRENFGKCTENISKAAATNPRLALKVAHDLAPYIDFHGVLATFVSKLYNGLRHTVYWTPANIRPWASITSGLEWPDLPAARLWNELYALDASDNATRNGFCKFLRLHRKTQLVRKVRGGKLLTEKDLKQFL